MDVSSILDSPEELSIRDVKWEPGRISLFAVATKRTAACPACGVLSRRVHSRYARLVDDLPWGERAVRLKLEVRRFFCDESACERRIFAERMPEWLAAWARRTLRLEAALRLCGLALGGEAGARLAAALHMETSADTIIRLVISTPLPALEEVRVLGVDDWAWKKGHTYGTVLVDLARRRVVDLLPDRAADSLARWLSANPGVEVIARDRARCYADGASRGAPGAVQVVDRFHLLRNVRDAVQRLLERRWGKLRAAFDTKAEQASPEIVVPGGETKAERDRQARRARRLACYELVMEMSAGGMGCKPIAAKTGLSPKTIRRYLMAGCFPEHQSRRRGGGMLAPFAERMRAWHADGVTTGPAMLRALRSVGFTGGKRTVERWLAQQGGSAPERAKRVKPAAKPPSIRAVLWRLLRPGEGDGEPSKTLDTVFSACPELQTASAMARQMFAMARERRADQLEGWLQAAAASPFQEFRTLATGLEQDRAAVEAALTYPWSTGQVEGQNHRLKLVKRQMYGRAGFELLRQRMLHAI